MTYNVFGGTLNLALSIYLNNRHMVKLNVTTYRQHQHSPILIHNPRHFLLWLLAVSSTSKVEPIKHISHDRNSKSDYILLYGVLSA